MRILVSGAHGFVGSHLTEALLEAEHDVRALVTPWGDLANLRDVATHPRLGLVRADITAPASLRGALDGIDVVVHAAARVAEWGPWEPYFETNVRGTETLLAEAERAGASRFVHISTVAVHRYTGFRNADPRELPLDGDVNAYAKSKRLAEQRVMATRRLEPVVVRPGLLVHGPRDPNFVRYTREIRRGTLPLVDGGSAVTNTAYIENFSAGVLLACSRTEAAGRVYLLADEGMPSWREIFTQMATSLGVRPPRLQVPGAAADVLGSAVERAYARFAPNVRPPLSRYMPYLVRRDTHLTIDAARDELGYRPLVDWRTGIDRTVRALEAAERETNTG